MSAAAQGGKTRRSRSCGVDDAPYQIPSPMYCKGCARPCRTKTSLDSHEKICPKMKLGKYESFFKLDPLRRGHPTASVPSAMKNLMASCEDDKVLPASQPLLPLAPEDKSDDLSPPASTQEIPPELTGHVSAASDAGHSEPPGSRTSLSEPRIVQVNEPTSRQNPVSSLDDESDNCPICRVDVSEEQEGIQCDLCKSWSHRECLCMPLDEYNNLMESNDEKKWFCVTCASIQSNTIKWGEMKGEVNIKKTITDIYNEVVTWRKNLFLVPRGKVGTEFIKEISNILKSFINPSKWNRIALAKLHIFIPLMLQKPSSQSKAKDHSKYLEKRMKLWAAGDLKSIMAENREIQKKLRRNHEKRSQSKDKNFIKLMLLGKISQAMKFINNEDNTRGVHSLSNEIKQLLEEKHPKARDIHKDILLPSEDENKEPEQVIFEEINGASVYKAAKQLQGSGGPTQIDADGWKHILCSRSYGNASAELCDDIADLAKKLCTVDIHPEVLVEFVSNRLIPLDKGADEKGNPGVRPIGIGEILRRIVGKVVVTNIRDDIINAAGPLQTCAGLKSGIEASIHAMRKIFGQDDTEALLLVDAENAFNNLNRKAALHNIKQLCPSFHRYLSNTYQLPAKMYISDPEKTDSIFSEEGSTQGDVGAMAMYAIGIRPLIDILCNKTDQSKCQQVWYADDSSAAGKLLEIRKWWDVLNETGPKFGYFPKAVKTILIVKDPQHFTMAEEIFSGTGIKITKEGERHLGAVIGTMEFRGEYITNKVNSWIKDVEELAKVANDEPQLAYSSYTKALSMRWCFVQRTIPNIKEYFVPLEQAIRQKFIPAILGRNITNHERNLFALPVRLGGMGIQDPTMTCDVEFLNSSRVTKNLTDLIINQEQNLSGYDAATVAGEILRSRAEKDESFVTKLAEVKTLADNNLKRYIEMAGEKGAGAWLNALPLQSAGYTLNKQQFRDAIYMRYGWKIPGTPLYCGCGGKNDLDHILNCKVGGYVAMRHNNIRDLEATLLKEVCKDVRVEPDLLPVGERGTQSRKSATKARLDVSAVGVWSACERTFLDVRVMHPNSPSYRDMSTKQLYEKHEQEKKAAYNERILQIEKGSFTPLVFSTTGGMGPESTKYHKRIAELIAAKRNEQYSDVMNHLRTRLRFSLLKSVLIAVRGQRGKNRKDVPMSDLSINLIPDRAAYEV